ncbi:hypothetical protein J1N35_043953 [Gossypium stocksii]|uniref:Uncharacterized protein n=1 Tax=Gossypium stocksii TaxID=47602 RepID=A0A9D3U8B0_9ROSI|nr:hypothetical protein J1N35_043953 [Gossypium stocksii]
MELEDEDDDLWSIITIYYPPKMDNPSPVELLAEITEPKPVQVVISVKIHPKVLAYNIPIPCSRLEIHPKVLATIEDGNEGSDNEEQSHYDNEDFNYLNLDDIYEDIDDEGAVDGEDVHLYSIGNMGSGIVIPNNPGAFMSDVDSDVMLARRQSNVLPITFAIMEGKCFESWEFFLRNLRRHAIKQDNICLVSNRSKGLLAAIRCLRVPWRSVYCI